MHFKNLQDIDSDEGIVYTDGSGNTIASLTSWDVTDNRINIMKTKADVITLFGNVHLPLSCDVIVECILYKGSITNINDKMDKLTGTLHI